MQKPLALSIAACLGLTGCNAFNKSETWSQAVKVRPAETTRDPDPSNAYSDKLHAAFAAQRVEHKVVVYQYHYTNRRHEEAVGTRTAVIYRDDANPNYPWWLKDDRLNNPFWLPNGSLDKQVSFYVRRKAEVIEVKEYPARGGSGKSTLAFAKSVPQPRKEARPEPRVAVTRLTPVKKAPAPVVVRKPAPVQEVAKPRAISTVVAKPVAAPKAAAPEAAVKPPLIVKNTEPAKRLHPEPVAKGPVTAIQAISSLFTPKPSPEKAPAASAALEPVAARNTGGFFWSPPGVLDADQQPAVTAPRDERLEKLFRAKHGTNYNRFSPTDRRKMQQLQNGVASRE